MATIYDLKPRFQALLRPSTRWLYRLGVTANQVTLAAMVMSLLAGAAVYVNPTGRWALLLVPIVLFVRMALNAIDGMLAREFGQKSDLGAVLNELGDVISDTALYLPLATVNGVTGELVVIAVVLAVIGELTGVVAIQIGSERRYDGPMGKSDRAFAFGLIYLLLGCGIQPGWWLDVFLGVIILLSAWTIANRSRRALKSSQTADES